MKSLTDAFVTRDWVFLHYVFKELLRERRTIKGSPAVARMCEMCARNIFTLYSLAFEHGPFSRILHVAAMQRSPPAVRFQRYREKNYFICFLITLCTVSLQNMISHKCPVLKWGKHTHSELSFEWMSAQGHLWQTCSEGSCVPVCLIDGTVRAEAPVGPVGGEKGSVDVSVCVYAALLSDSQTLASRRVRGEGTSQSLRSSDDDTLLWPHELRPSWLSLRLQTSINHFIWIKNTHQTCCIKRIMIYSPSRPSESICCYFCECLWNRTSVHMIHPL